MQYNILLGSLRISDLRSPPCISSRTCAPGARISWGTPRAGHRIASCTVGRCNSYKSAYVRTTYTHMYTRVYLCVVTHMWTNTEACSCQNSCDILCVRMVPCNSMYMCKFACMRMRYGCNRFISNFKSAWYTSCIWLRLCRKSTSENQEYEKLRWSSEACGTPSHMAVTQEIWRSANQKLMEEVATMTNTVQANEGAY